MAAPLRLFELVDSKTRTISFSPAVWRAKYALRRKNLPYETVPVTFLEIPVKIPEACPNVEIPLVPTLQVEDGQGLLDSLKIAEYLEEKYPDRPLIFGASPSEKKLQLFFQSYVQAKLHPAIQRLVFSGMYEMQDSDNALYFRTSREKSLGTPHDKIPGDRNKNLREIKENLGIIRDALQSSDWIYGDQPGWADFVLGSSFSWFHACAPENFKDAVLDAFDDSILSNYWTRVRQYVGEQA
ncbi:hypothetical protein B0O80DRAFT_122810 [Mortierella sp. GBAus27b]|nr:hypothetical protein BGX31_002958 [Mortierella sp. GBA43]KAI8351111.1 hypothetical protein B0O80DRAFT_122810 [Mortierella sp. GBAus27b]